MQSSSIPKRALGGKVLVVFSGNDPVNGMQTKMHDISYIKTTSAMMCWGQKRPEWDQ